MSDSSGRSASTETLRGLFPHEAWALAQKETVFWIDLRDEEERDAQIAGAMRASPHRMAHLLEAGVSKDANVIVYCQHSERSRVGVQKLMNAGFQKAFVLLGGFAAWQESGLATSRTLQGEPANLRYARQEILREFGSEGQDRLAQSRVLIVGCGGLGSAVAMALCASGVGMLGLIDPDRVQTSNLARQTAYDASMVGQNKVDALGLALLRNRPDAQIKSWARAFDESCAAKVMAEGWDAIVDGLDNHASRLLLNDEARASKIPWVHGSAARWEGRVSTFVHGPLSPCYRCLQATIGTSEESCSVVGVMAVVPSLVANIQALEVIKILSSVGKTLQGRLLCMDAREGEMHSFDYASIELCSWH